MKLNKLIAIATISLLSGGISMAQKALNLEDIVAGNIIQTKGIGSMTWLKDGERYSRLENNKQTGGTDIVAYRAKDNSREVIIPSSLLTDKSTGRPIPVRSVSWSADNEKILIYNNTRRVWRYDTRGDYWVLNLKDGALRQLGKGMPESSMMFAKFSPDGTRVAYVSNNNIYVEDIDLSTEPSIGYMRRSSVAGMVSAGARTESISPIGKAIRKERECSTLLIM